MAELEVRQVRSANGASPRQRDTLRSLRLGRIGKSATLSDGPQLRGMLKVVDHLVEVGEPGGGKSGAKSGGGKSGAKSGGGKSGSGKES